MSESQASQGYRVGLCLKHKQKKGSFIITVVQEREPVTRNREKEANKDELQRKLRGWALVTRHPGSDTLIR